MTDSPASPRSASAEARSIDSIGSSLETPLPGQTEDLALGEMLKILDAAGALRKERMRASLALEEEETRRLLRERLMEAARVSGDRVSPAEVDAAIERYYATLHAFEPAPRGWQRTLAHLYIRRGRIAAIGGGLLIWATLVWWLFLSGIGPFSKAGRQRRALDAALESIEESREELTALAVEPDVDRLVEERWLRAQELREAGQVEQLQVLEVELDELGAELRLDYSLRIVSEPGKRSGVRQDFNDQLSGHYLIVEALDDDGNPVRLPVRDAEDDRVRVVSRWGELVPEAVYDRVAEDKRADGIVDERLVAEKERGHRSPRVVLLGTDGSPIELTRQITEWDD